MTKFVFAGIVAHAFILISRLDSLVNCTGDPMFHPINPFNDLQRFYADAAKGLFSHGR